MAFPTILFNSSTGSDTQASGAGPGTAVFGTNASFAASIITLDGSPSLAGVATDGSAVIWMQTSTGRQFFTINAKDDVAKTVTVDDAPAGTSTGRTWAIGGKRQTINGTNSRLLFTADVKGGWIIDLEGTFTQTSVITINSLSGNANGFITVQCSAVTRAIITSATNSQVLFNGGSSLGWIWRHINFTHTAGTRGDGFVASGVNSVWWIDDCVFDGFHIAINGDYITNFTYAHMRITRTEVKNCTNVGIFISSGNLEFIGCYIHDNASHGFQGGAATPQPWDYRGFENCVIVDNGGKGIYWSLNNSNTFTTSIKNCTIANNTGNGIEIVGTTVLTRMLTVINNIIYGNATQIVVNGVTEIVGYNNALDVTNPRSGYTSLPGEFTLSVDPFTNSPGGDYTLNNTAGGGTLCRAAALPGPMGSMTGYLDLGALQTQGGGAAASQHTYGF